MGIYRGVTAEALEAYEKRVCMGACIDRWMSGISRISCRALSRISRISCPSLPPTLSLARSLPFSLRVSVGRARGQLPRHHTQTQAVGCHGGGGGADMSCNSC